MLFVTPRRLNSATADVRRELDRLGFYNPAIQSVPVRLVPAGKAYGWQYYGSSGEIHIPCISWARLSHLFAGGYTSLRDVLRHEYAHAVADTHRGLIRSARFRDAFGAAHSWDFAWEYDPEHHVTDYAASAPAEDYAETFMLYVRHGGRLPAAQNTARIRARWRFVRDLGRMMRDGRRRW
jgi:hypothetical protein